MTQLMDSTVVTSIEWPNYLKIMHTLTYLLLLGLDINEEYQKEMNNLIGKYEIFDIMMHLANELFPDAVCSRGASEQQGNIQTLKGLKDVCM